MSRYQDAGKRIVSQPARCTNERDATRDIPGPLSERIGVFVMSERVSKSRTRTIVHKQTQLRGTHTYKRAHTHTDKRARTHTHINAHTRNHKRAHSDRHKQPNKEGDAVGRTHMDYRGICALSMNVSEKQMKIFFLFDY